MFFFLIGSVHLSHLACILTIWKTERVCCKANNMLILITFFFSFCFLIALSILQQSAAFKILRTRLKTVPSFALSTENLKRTSSENPYSQILQIADESNRNQDVASTSHAIDFPARLQQFVHMQQLHRAHTKFRQQSRNAAYSTLSQV